MTYFLAIDQGTTNSRALLFNQQGHCVGQHTIQLRQFFPDDGWVEQDAEEMFQNTVECCRNVLKNAGFSASDIAAVGIANQRETTIIWDKQTGRPIYPAIVWQDRRTTDICKRLSHSKLSQQLQKKTGLLLDPYFSATKIVWLLENVKHARERAEAGELLFGTVDSFLLWKLTKGKSHFTDVTNASRTLLFNIHTQQWDKEILDAFQIPAVLLPRVLDNTANFGDIDSEFLGKKIAITGMAGDQQAATIGQACFTPGMIKATYGTGCFMLLNTGKEVIQSRNQLLSTIAYRINGDVTYGLEGSIFNAGTIVKWLRDTLQLINTASETETIASSVNDTPGVYLIPAFTGLGAPYWDANARGALFGLTRNSNKSHIVRAALESVAYQTRDLLDAMLADSQTTVKTLRVDGGMTVNNWLLQFISDIVHLDIERPVCVETSALGVAYLAGLQIGMYQSLDEIAERWQSEARYTPHMASVQSEMLYKGWQYAIQKVLS